MTIAEGTGAGGFSNGFGDPALVVTSKGRIICMSCAGDKNFWSGQKDVAMIYSDDNGRSWSKPVNITDFHLNKPMLAEFLLKSDENTAIVNHIVHPAVAEDFVQSGKQWMECAILFSSGFNRLVDRVVCVTAPLEVRLDRIVKRDGITREKAREWIDKQWPL